MSVSAPKANAPAEFQPVIFLGDICLHLATSSRSIDIHGERRVTDSSLHAFFFVGELDDCPSPRSHASSQSPGSAPSARLLWYYSPLADFEKKRLRVEETVVAAAVSAALGLCAASKQKASTMASSPKMPQVYVRVGKTSTFRKYEYVMPSPTADAPLVPPSQEPTGSPARPAASATTPPRLDPPAHTFAAKTLDLSFSPQSPTSTRSPDPSPVPPLRLCPVRTAGAPTCRPSPLTERPMADRPDDAGDAAERSATVEISVCHSLENGFEAATSDRPYAEAGLMELPHNPPRQQRLLSHTAATAGTSGKPFTPLCDRITPLTNGRRSRRDSAYRHAHTTDENGSARSTAPSVMVGDSSTTVMTGKAMTLSPGGSSTPFLSCSMGRTNSFQLNGSTTTLGNISGSTVNGWIVNVDEGLCDSADQGSLTARSSTSRSLPSQAALHPRPPRLVSPRAEMGREAATPLPVATLLHAPVAPKQPRLPRRLQPTAPAQNEWRNTAVLHVIEQ